MANPADQVFSRLPDRGARLAIGFFKRVVGVLVLAIDEPVIGVGGDGARADRVKSSGLDDRAGQRQLRRKTLDLLLRRNAAQFVIDERRPAVPKALAPPRGDDAKQYP